MTKSPLFLHSLLTAMLFCIISLFSSHTGAQTAANILYAVGAGGEIHVLTFDKNKHDLKLLQTVHGDRLPVSLALHPQGQFLFSANKLGFPSMSEWGSVSSYVIDSSTGRISLVNEQPSYGNKPVHISVYQTANWMFVSNYGGELAILSIDPKGRIGASSQQTRFQDKLQGPLSGKVSRPSFSCPTGDGRFIYVIDIGLDKVFINRFDNRKGTMAPAAQPWVRTGGNTGTVAFAIHPESDIAFMVEQKSSTIHTFRINNNDGSLTSVMTQKTIPSDFKGQNRVSDMHLHPNGHYLYATNSGHNNIVVIDVLEVNHLIKFRGGVPVKGNPVSFTIDPMGKFAFVALEDKDTIAIFNITGDGNLKEAGAFKIASPSIVLFSGTRR